MGNQQSRGPRREVPNIQFRVLIIGRANAGKTSILQRVCDTTESPVIYRGNDVVKLDPSMDRGEHTIDDELVFSNHKGYVFHDSRGIESGSSVELEIMQGFIRRKCGEKQLKDRLHAIWFCVPMDNQRPQLDLKYYKDICPDQNVPVIVVFTKYDQFLRNVAMHLSDFPNEYPDSNVSEVTETLFQEHYVQPLGDDIRFVQLKQMHMPNSNCNDLIEKTAVVLDEDIVALMLFAVQKDNLRLSVKATLTRVNPNAGSDVRRIIQECLFTFPYIWFFDRFQKLDLSAGELSFHKSSEVKSAKELDLRFGEYSQQYIEEIMSLSSIQTITRNTLGHHHLMLAVIIILKNASVLLVSNMSNSKALRHADLQYQVANIDLKIQEFLISTTTSQEQFIMQSVNFIMAIDLDILVPSQSLLKGHKKGQAKKKRSLV